MPSTLGLLAGAAFGSGVNLYAVVALLGLLGRTGATEVPDTLTSAPVIGVAAALYSVEFVVDKVPVLDSAWDAVHTVVRPAGAGVVGALLAGGAGGLEAGPAAGAAGGLALVAHAAKASARAAINTSPEPASNIVVSLLEDGLVAGLVWLAVHHPLVALAVVVLLTVVAVLMTVMLWRAVRALVGRIAARRAQAG